MTRVLFALVALSLVTLACGGQFIATVTPSPTAEVTPEPVVATSPTPAPTALPTATPAEARLEPSTAIVVSAAVNVRAAPAGAVVGSVKAGDEVNVIGCGTDPERDDFGWCEIEWPKLEHAFIFAGCLTVESGLGCEAE